jgi:hypothetical protein
MTRQHFRAVLLCVTALLVAGCASGTEEAVPSLSPGGEPPAANLAPPSTAAAAPEQPSAPQAEGERVTMTQWDLWAAGETTLRGVNIYQRLIYPELDGDWLGPGPVGPPVVQQDFYDIADAGINYVNLSHSGLFSEQPPFELVEGVQDNLDSVLEMMTAADLFAVISFRTGPGRSDLGFWGVNPDDNYAMQFVNDTVWEDPAAQDAWVEMWRYTAERYRDNPIVVGYDLMVEPNANALFFDMYWPPDFYPAYAGTLYDWNQFYPRIVEAIREVDPDTPILVGAMSWSSVDWLPYLEVTDDPRTVYAVHQYEPHDYTHQEPGADGSLPITYPGELDFDWDGQPDPFNRDWMVGLLSTVADFQAEHGVPVAVNEYGAQRYEPGAAQYLDDEMGLFEDLGLNYAIWSWSPAFWMQVDEVKSFEARLGPDPNNHFDVVPNAMWDVLTSYWARNTLRPSQVTFVPAGD